MSTNTAHFLIGQPHIVHDGIQPQQQLVLTENSRPGLFLAELPSPSGSTMVRSTVTSSHGYPR